MGAIREFASVTSKGQITLPKSVRQLLGVESGDKVVFDVLGAQVVVRRADDQPHIDPAILGFLALLEKDIHGGRRIGALPEGLARSMAAAATCTPSDADEEIEGDVAL
jgi:antitoxin PrlF